jgi:hypothetical protein
VTYPPSVEVLRKSEKWWELFLAKVRIERSTGKVLGVEKAK